MAYTVKIDNDRLIDLLQDHYDDKIYENIKENDRITAIELLRCRDIEIIIGEDS